MLFLNFVGGGGEVGNAYREFEGQRSHVAVEHPTLTRHRRDAGVASMLPRSVAPWAPGSVPIAQG